MSYSLRASPTGSMARWLAMTKRSKLDAAMSLRSSVVVQGSTMSARLAAGVHHGSWIIIVSGFAQPLSRLLRSCCLWNGFPPHQ